MSERFAGRSVHGAPKHAKAQAEDPRLRVNGLVENERELSPADLEGLPRRHYLDHVRTDAATHIPETDWSGVLIRDVINLAGAREGAHWIRISAGPYATVITLEDAERVLLCDRIGDQPIPVENGGPWRLLRPDSIYNTSVKWVDTLTLSAEQPDNSGERIARARQHARDAKAAKLADSSNSFTD
jgi:DMSO/TMAO reductase YedYZ molybdopterin-dependent catalytic subunit